MAPKKKTKSARSTNKDDKTVDPWVQELIGKTINEDGWRCNVTIMFDSDSSVSFYNKLLTTYCADKSNVFRNSFKIISYSDFKQSIIFDQAVETGDPSKVKPYNKLCTHLNAVMQSVNSSDKNHFPRLLASFIKYKILQLKEESIFRHQLIEEFKQKEKVDEEDNRILFEECLANKVDQQQGKTKKKTASKKLSRKDERKTGNKRETRKFTTTLKRGEEFLNEIHIEDEPENDVQMYVVLTGFLEPNLPLELIALRVPLVGLLKLNKASLTSASSSQVDDQSEIIERLKLDENLFDSNPTQDTKIINHLYIDFWRDFFVLLMDRKNYDKFENVIFYPFSVILPQEDHYANMNDVITNLSKQAYDNIAQVQYNLSEIINDRIVYSSSLKQINVEDIISKDSTDFSEYNRLLDSISQDCVEVYHILEAILQQITKTTATHEDYDDFEEVEQFPSIGPNNDDNGDDDAKENSIISRDLELSTIGCHISRLEEIHDLASKPDSKTLGKIDEQGIVFDYEDKSEIRMYRYHKDNRNHNFEDDAIQLLKTFWRKCLGIANNRSEDNHHIHQTPINKSTNNHMTINSRRISLDMHGQTEGLSLKKINFSNNDRDSYRNKSPEFSRASPENYGINNVVDENDFENLCSIPCGHINALIEDKKMNFCFDVLNTHHNNEDSPAVVDGSENVDETKYCGKFCYTEMRSKILVQNLFESIEDHACLDIKTNIVKQGWHNLRFHTLCCLPERTFAGSLRTADVCLRDFFDFIVPESAAPQTDLVTRESSMESAIIEADINYQHNVDQWCLNEDLIDSNSLKSSTAVAKDTLLNAHETPAEASDQVNCVADIGITQPVAESCSNKKMLDAFELDSTRYLNFTEKVRQVRFSKTFTTKIRILSDSFNNNDCISIEPSIGDYTLYIYAGLKQKVHYNTKFHIRHRSGMIVYFERTSAAIINQDSGLFLNPAIQPNFDTNRKFIPENSFSTRTLNNEQQKQLSYRFSLSWPSCMHLDFFNGNQLCPAYIRQWYSAPNNHTDDEVMRCYTQNGEILKFMRDESVIVYYPNGKIYHHMPTRSSSTSFRSFGTDSQKIIESKNDEFDYSGEATHSIYECEQTFQDLTNGTLKSELSNGVVVTHTHNGDLVVDFPDGSRITSLLECELQVVVDGDTIFEKQFSSNNGNDCHEEEFVLISAHYLIEHARFASVSFSRFGNNMKVGLPYDLSISIDSKNDCFLVNLTDESRIEIEKSEINIFDGNSLRSSVLLSNIQEYSSTYPQFDRYEFFNCKFDSKCVLLVDSWGDISADHLYFRGNCTNEFENMYYIVRDDLSGYKIYPIVFETKLDQLTGNKEQCVINKSVNSGYKSALFIQPSEAREWKMNFESYNIFQRSQSTVDCCRFSWLNPISIVRNEKLSIINDESAQLLTVGLLQWFKSREQCNERRNKIIHNAIIRDNDYRAAMEIYKKGDQFFASERHQVIDQAERIVSQTLKRVQSIFSRRETLNKINRYKQLLKHDRYCKYFDTKVGMSFLIADEIVSHALSMFMPREIGKFISSSVTEELIKIAIEKAELQKIHREIGKLISSSVTEELIENAIEKAELQAIHSDIIG